MTWTPVIKSVPVVGKHLLIAGTSAEEDVHEQRFICIGIFLGKNSKAQIGEERTCWVVPTAVSRYPFIVTHWMPLPFLPENSNRKNPWIERTEVSND